MIFTAGNKGDGIKSDCWVELIPGEESGIDIKIHSKVKTLFGTSIQRLCEDMLIFHGILNARLTIEDKGALPFVIAARLEYAIKQANISKKNYLSEFLPENRYSTPNDLNRFSRLYIPGNSPKLMINAGIYGSGGIILDLEDSVSHDKKDEARYLVKNALGSIDFKGSERMVRINQLPLGLKDLEAIVPQRPNLILLPKCESTDQVKEVDNMISSIIPFSEYPIYIMPIIESALGVVNAYNIAVSSERNVALALGLEDYTADIGTQRTNEAKESFYARSAVVNAARAAGLQPIDSVFSDVSDMKALAATVKESKSLGFVGMGCIHPRQVPVINRNFGPEEEEINKAKKIVIAFEEAEARGLGVVSLGSKMIDPPVVNRALNTINLAVSLGQISKEWRTDNE